MKKVNMMKNKILIMLLFLGLFLLVPARYSFADDPGSDLYGNHPRLWINREPNRPGWARYQRMLSKMTTENPDGTFGTWDWRKFENHVKGQILAINAPPPSPSEPDRISNGGDAAAVALMSQLRSDNPQQGVPPELYDDWASYYAAKAIESWYKSNVYDPNRWVNAATNNTLTSNNQSWQWDENKWQDRFVTVYYPGSSVPAATRQIIHAQGQTLTVSPDWDITPPASYVIFKAGNFGYKTSIITSATENTLEDITKTWPASNWTGRFVNVYINGRIITREIVSGSSNTITVSEPWDEIPPINTLYRILNKPSTSFNVYGGQRKGTALVFDWAYNFFTQENKQDMISFVNQRKEQAYSYMGPYFNAVYKDIRGHLCGYAMYGDDPNADYWITSAMIKIYGGQWQDSEGNTRSTEGVLVTYLRPDGINIGGGQAHADGYGSGNIEQFYSFLLGAMTAEGRNFFDEYDGYWQDRIRYVIYDVLNTDLRKYGYFKTGQNAYQSYADTLISNLLEANDIYPDSYGQYFLNRIWSAWNFNPDLYGVTITEIFLHYDSNAIEKSFDDGLPKYYYTADKALKEGGYNYPEGVGDMFLRSDWGFIPRFYLASIAADDAYTTQDSEERGHLGIFANGVDILKKHTGWDNDAYKSRTFNANTITIFDPVEYWWGDNSYDNYAGNYNDGGQRDTGLESGCAKNGIHGHDRAKFLRQEHNDSHDYLAVDITNAYENPQWEEDYDFRLAYKGTAESGTATSLTDTDANWAPHQWQKSWMRIQWGTGEGQYRYITDSNETTLYFLGQDYVNPPRDRGFDTPPDETSEFWITQQDTSLLSFHYRPKVKEDGVQRELVYLRQPGVNVTGDFTFVFDRIEASKSHFTRKANWRSPDDGKPELYKADGTPAEPVEDTSTQDKGHVFGGSDQKYEVQAYNASICKMSKTNPDTGNQANLFIKALLPEEHIMRRVGGEKQIGTDTNGKPIYENWAGFVDNTSKTKPGDYYLDYSCYQGWWRVETIAPEDSTQTNFLHVLYTTDATTASMPATTLVEGDTMAGALVNAPGARLVMFAKTADKISDVTYQVNSSAVSTKHLLVDMQPGFYNVEQNDERKFSDTPASSNGTLSFALAGGGAFHVIMSGKPSIYITSPVDGYSADSTPITVTGIASDDQGILSVTVNTITATIDVEGSWTAEGIELTEGENTITATVTDTDNNETEKSIKVYLTSQMSPVADFEGTPTEGYAPLPVQFTDTSTNNPTSWEWDFGDESEHSTQQNPSYEYAQAGTYTVSLTAANNDGSDTETKTDYITVNDSGDTTPPTPSTNLHAEAVSSSVIDLTWDASISDDVEGYKIYRDGDVIDTTADTSYQDTGLAANTQYTYQVSAYDEADNESAKSEPPINATTPPSDGTIYVCDDATDANQYGEGGWGEPSDSNNGESKGYPFKTIGHALDYVQSGDTLIIGSGTYKNTSTGVNNIIDNVASGTADDFTLIQAEVPFRVTLDGENNPWKPGEYADMIYLANKSHIHIDGIFVFRGVSFIHRSNNIKITRCGFAEATPAGAAQYNLQIAVSSDVLVEDCFTFGEGRYKFGVSSGGTSHNILFRRCVGRYDYYYMNGGGTGVFCNYNNDNVIFQNCIAIDGLAFRSYSDPNHFDDMRTSGFINSHSVNKTTIDGCMVLNSYGNGVMSEGEVVTGMPITNTVLWDIYSGTGTCTWFTLVNGDNGLSNIQHVTSGSTDVIRKWMSAYGIPSPIENTIFYGFTNPSKYGANNGFNSTYNCYFGNNGNNGNTSDFDYVDDPAYNPLWNEETNPNGGLKYLVRIEKDSNLDGAGTGSDQEHKNGETIGATILNQIGVSGTFYGEAGWNADTGKPLWPWTNEDIIKEIMSNSEYNMHANDRDLSGNPINFKRGFCADGTGLYGGPITLTSYIWEYLGNPLPPDIYDNDYPPILNIASPQQDDTFNTRNITVTGEASDNEGEVTVKVNDTDAVFTDDTHWSANTTLEEGDGEKDITAEATDNNEQTTEKTIKVILDTTSPYTSDHDPQKGETGVSPDTNIILKINDLTSGVDIETIMMYVEDQRVTPIIEGGALSYTLTYNPDEDFGYSQEVSVEVRASDLAKNSMQDIYSFITKQQEKDETPPTTTEDLAATSADDSSVITLSWTAPGDDGDSGTASSYDIRYSHSEIKTNKDWEDSTELDNEPAPKQAGQQETFQVDNLYGQLYFALKTSDEVFNESGISNNASIQKLSPPVITSITATPVSGAAPLQVSFDAEAVDYDGQICSYEWDFEGDSFFEASNIYPDIEFNYLSAGEYSAILKVTDDTGLFATAGVVITVSDNPQAPVFTLTAHPMQAVVPFTLTLRAEGDHTKIIEYCFDINEDNQPDILSAKPHINIEVTEPGFKIYTVKAKDMLGVESIASVWVNAQEPGFMKDKTFYIECPQKEEILTPVIFKAQGSLIQEEEIVKYQWFTDNGDAVADYTGDNLIQITHKYSATGTNNVACVVTTDKGISRRATAKIRIQDSAKSTDSSCNFSITANNFTVPVNASFVDLGSNADIFYFDPTGKGKFRSVKEKHQSMAHTYLRTGQVLAKVKARLTQGKSSIKTIPLLINGTNTSCLNIKHPGNLASVHGIIPVVVEAHAELNSNIYLLYKNKTAQDWIKIETPLTQRADSDYYINWDTANLSGQIDLKATLTTVDNQTSESTVITVDVKNSNNADFSCVKDELGIFTVTAKIADTSDNTVYLPECSSVEIPLEAVDKNTTGKDIIIVKVIPKDKLAGVNPLANSAEYCFDIDFDSCSATLSLNTSALSTDDKPIMPYCYNPQTNTWERVWDYSMIDGTVTFQTAHLSLFGLGGLFGGDGGGSGGGEGGGGGGGGCFIATACYGTPQAQEVKILSAFRDKYLLTDPFGTQLVHFYYKHSPKWAEYIKDKPALKRAIRILLRPVVWMVMKLQ
ncbi:MAG: PKD domain-containing protein [Candidatus Omnitrophota bacterium]